MLVNGARGRLIMAFIKQECRGVSVENCLELKRETGDDQWREIIRVLDDQEIRPKYKTTTSMVMIMMITA